MEFESAKPSVVKSIKQRDLLNTWLRLYARDQSMPRMSEYQPARIEDELPDLVFYTVDTGVAAAAPDHRERRHADVEAPMGIPARAAISTSISAARLAPIVMPVYYECIARRLPVYTIADIDDIYGRIVAYERLLLPFSDGDGVTHIIASLKTISEDGGFEIRNLMRGNDKLPVPKLRAIIDRDLFHRAPGRIAVGRRDRIRLDPILFRAAWTYFLGVDVRLESDQQFAAEIEHRPLDHRGLRQHQRQRLALVQAFLVAVGQLLERRAGAVEQRFPADFVGPLLELVLGDAGGL